MRKHAKISQTRRPPASPEPRDGGQAPGVLHHIMIRGIERRKIFRNNKDREDLLDRISNLLPETETACYAWAFLANHAHFLFRTGPIPLATLMRRLLTGYVVSFNRRHKRPCQSSLTGRAWTTLSESLYINQLYVRRRFICENW